MTLQTDSGLKLTLSLHGEIDMSTAEGIAGATSLAQDYHRDLVLDLSAVTFMDSQGVNGLLRAAHEMAATGSTLVIRHPSTAVRRVIDVMGLTEYIGLEP